MFSPATLTFLRGLKRHNERPWFESHRGAYESSVLEPMRELIEEMDVRFGRMAPEIIGEPRRSMFRIYRDVRFSRDKSPYKTHAACWFYHHDAARAVGKEGEGGSAGFYFQIAPGDSFSGGGVWMPPRGQLSRIRDAIAAHPDQFTRLVTEQRAGRRFGRGLSDETVLTRMPRGYPDDHPAARWLRFQSFTVGRALTDTQAVSRRLPDILERDFALILPLVRFLNTALGLRPADRR